MFTKLTRVKQVAASATTATVMFGMLAVPAFAQTAGTSNSSLQALLAQLQAQVQALQAKVQSTSTTTQQFISNTATGVAGNRSAIRNNDVQVGSTIVTTTNLNVRATPDHGGTKLGLETTGSQGTVVGGPAQMVNGQIQTMSVVTSNSWWQIDYADGVSGWSNSLYVRNTTAASDASVTCTDVHFNPSTIQPYQNTTLMWNTTNATKVTINSDTGYVNTSTNLPLNGSLTFSPSRSGHYYVYAYRADGTHVSCPTWITVNTPIANGTVSTTTNPIVRNTISGLAGTRNTVTSNNVQVGDTVVATHNIGAKMTPDYNGTTTGSVSAGTQGYVTAGPSELVNGQIQSMSAVTTNSWFQVNFDNGVTGWANVSFIRNANTATADSNAPTCSNVGFNPNVITKGQSTTYTWHTANANRVMISSDVGYYNVSSLPVNGSLTLTPNRSGHYYLYAFGGGQSVTCQSWVTVNPAS